MDFTFVLSGKFARFGLLAGVVVFAGLLLLAALNNFIIRALTDTRFRRPVPNLELLRNATNYLPNSARLNLALGQTELTGNPNPQRAIQHATLAVELAPADFQGWYLLGLAQDTAGNQAAAERAFTQAVQLAPTNSEVNWAAANAFLRSGQVSAALIALRVATAGDESLLPSALELVWQASGRNVDTLNRLAAGRAQAQFALALFLAEQSLFAEAVTTYQRLPRAERLTDPRSPAFITKLLTAKQFPAAHALWLEMVASNATTAAQTGLWNGGFELTAPPGFDQFNWKLGKTDYARLSLERGQARTGEYALKIMFAGRDTTKLVGEAEQLLVLSPGATYQLECYAKAAEMVTSLGPQAALFQAGALLAATEPVTPGTTDWQRLTVNFTAPANGEPVSLRVVRRPKYAYDEPTHGTVWFDDFQLSCLGGC